MRLFAKQALSAASLIVLLPTIILAPYAAFMLLVGLSRLGKLIADPAAFLASSPGHTSLAALGSEALSLVVWAGGYFLSILVYVLLLFPLPRKANFILWVIPALYQLVMLLSQPWRTHGFEEGFANWAMGSLSILLPLALLGLCFEWPKRRKTPPPFPSSEVRDSRSGVDDQSPQALPLTLTTSSP